MMWGTGGSLAELAHWVRQDGSCSTLQKYSRASKVLSHYRGWPPSEPGRQTSHPQHHQNYIHSTSTPYFTTTMDPILDAIAEIESRKPGASFLYRQLAKKYQCN
jgi:hypothetical protein